MRRIGLVTLLLLTLAPLGWPGAAAAADTASDGEVFAAYCLGVVEKWRMASPPACPEPNNAALCAALEARAAAEAGRYEARAQRLNRYLRAQGFDYVMGQGFRPAGQARRTPTAYEAITVAHGYGAADGAECASDGTEPEPTSPIARDFCAPKCGPAGRESEECATCMAEIAPQPAVTCRLAQRCNEELSRLPY
jgi:hypothetical protein